MAKEHATELEWLKYFYGEADFGPATDDVVRMIEEDFVADTGKLLPKGYEREDDNEE